MERLRNMKKSRLYVWREARKRGVRERRELDVVEELTFPPSPST
jgi:hypothetical protein